MNRNIIIFDEQQQEQQQNSKLVQNKNKVINLGFFQIFITRTVDEQKQQEQQQNRSNKQVYENSKFDDEQEQKQGFTFKTQV